MEGIGAVGNAFQSEREEDAIALHTYGTAQVNDSF